MSNYEIVYFDVDGTLFDNKNFQVPQSAIDAIQALKAKGLKVALCTGRNITSIDFVKDLVAWDGYVLSNGCAVYDHNLEPLFENPMNPDFLGRLIQASEAPLFMEGDALYLSKEPHDKIKNALQFFNSQAPIEIIDYADHKIFNVMSYDYDELDHTHLQDFDTHAYMHRDIMGNVEIVPIGTGKHKGCEVLNAHLNVTNFVGFGDGENDIDFLKHATTSVAMGNAKPHIQSVADHVTTTVDNDGILNGLKIIGLL